MLVIFASVNQSVVVVVVAVVHQAGIRSSLSRALFCL
jgi:hypothetical protein